MKNKNLSSRKKRVIEQNEYLMTNLNKIKDDNDNYKKKIIKLEKLNKNLLKDYEELSNDFNKIKAQKEKIESFSEEQKNKISELTKEIKSLHNLLKETINQQKQKQYYNNNDNNDSESGNENVKRYKNKYKINNDSDDDDYDNYDNNYNRNKNQGGFNKTSLQFYPKNKKVEFNDEYDNNEYNSYIKRNSNRIKNKNYNSINAHEEERRYSEIIDKQSPRKTNKNRSYYYDMEDQEDIYNGIENDDFLNHNFSTRNIFTGKKSVKRKLGEYITEQKQRKKINGNKFKESINNDYMDYDGYEGFNCFPCERKQKMNRLEIDELNNDLNILLKNKNIMENNLIKLPGQSKSIINIRQKKELNNKIKQTENKINEIRVRLKKLKGL
jgi:hypothetical protein